MPRNSNTFYDKIIKKDKTYRSEMPEVAAYLRSLMRSDEFKMAFGERGEQVSRDLDTLFTNLEDSYGAAELEDAFAGFQECDNIALVLKNKNRNGISCAEALMNAAIARDKSPDRLCESLYYMNEKLNMGMQLRTLLPGSIRPKKRMTGEPSWENYMKSHFTEVPYDRKGREEYIAKVLVGAYKDNQTKRPNGNPTPFSVKAARSYTEKLVKNKVFKKFCENRTQMDKFVHNMGKKPEELYKITAQIYRPFVFVPQERRMEVLGRLKKMADLMDGPRVNGVKWQALQRSMAGIDLNNPEACGEEKLKEIYDLTCDYMKGKKSIRSNDQEKNRFDQALDILAELSKCGDFAKLHVQTVFDRVNEVRLAKDDNYKPIKIVNYGAAKLLSHTNVRNLQRKSEYKDWLKYPNGKPLLPTIQCKVFDKIPGGDPSRLPKATGSGEDYLIINSALKKFEPMLTSKEVTTNMMIRYISFVLGTADTNTYYYRTTGKTGAYRVVVNKQELNGNINNYLNDPAVRKLAVRYKPKENRQGLFDELGSLHSVDHELLRNQLAEIKQEMEQEKKQEKKKPVKGK